MEKALRYKSEGVASFTLRFSLSVVFVMLLQKINRLINSKKQACIRKHLGSLPSLQKTTDSLSVFISSNISDVT